MHQETAGVTARAVSAGADDPSRMRTVGDWECVVMYLRQDSRTVPAAVAARPHAAPPDGPELRRVFTGGTILDGSPTSVALPHGKDDQVVESVAERVTSLLPTTEPSAGRGAATTKAAQRAVDALAGVTAA